MLQQVLHLDGHVVGERRPLAVQRFHNGDGVAGAVQKIGIAEGDVLGAGGYLLADVRQHHVLLHDAKRSAIDRDHGAMAAQMLAAARGFGVAHALSGAVRSPVGRRRPGAARPRAVGHQETLARQGYRRRAVGTRIRRTSPPAAARIRRR